MRDAFRHAARIVRLSPAKVQRKFATDSVERIGFAWGFDGLVCD